METMKEKFIIAISREENIPVTALYLIYDDQSMEYEELEWKKYYE